jgi:hypothetical protein
VDSHRRCQLRTLRPLQQIDQAVTPRTNLPRNRQHNPATDRLLNQPRGLQVNRVRCLQFCRQVSRLCSLLAYLLFNQQFGHLHNQQLDRLLSQLIFRPPNHRDSRPAAQQDNLVPNQVLNQPVGHLLNQHRNLLTSQVFSQALSPVHDQVLSHHHNQPYNLPLNQLSSQQGSPPPNRRQVNGNNNNQNCGKPGQNTQKQHAIMRMTDQVRQNAEYTIIIDDQK